MPIKIYKHRIVPAAETPFVVFMFGVRINKPLQIHKWWPVKSALKHMLRDLESKSDTGFLGYEYWSGNPCLTIQYWRSLDQLKQFARDKAASHFPAWFAFNNQYSSGGAIGIWHETYLVQEGCNEAVYKNMPAFGLAKATARKEVGGVKTAP